MKVEKLPDGRLALQFTAEEARKLDAQIAAHTGNDMPTEALNLASALRSAWYEVNDDFRQPPNAWEPGARFPTIET
ncbi:MAG TPA: hypothetical protein VKA76_15530 [Gammaproteobacteria bacterium]|nr:hypothetical protein [Gammaproteobacteria bacterium]